MKALVTGIYGFVGTELRKALVARGHTVYGIDVKSNDEAVEAVDITDLASVRQALIRIAPDAIYHLAAISRVDFDNPSLLYNINVNGTLNLLTAAAGLSVKPRFMLVSSSQVYGIPAEPDKPIEENTPVRPVNHYGASKAAGEHITRVFNYEHGLPAIIVRPFNHIGRGQDPHFIVPKIVSAVKEKRYDLSLGNLSVTRDFLDVRDVVAMYILLMEQFHDGETFNIASGTGYTISEILGMIQEIAHVSLNIKTENTLLRKNEIVKSVGSCAKFLNHYDYRPARSIKDTLTWMLSE